MKKKTEVTCPTNIRACIKVRYLFNSLKCFNANYTIIVWDFIFRYKFLVYIPGGQKTEQSIFQDFALINSYLFFTLLDRASFPQYNNTKIIKFGWELYFMSNFLWTVIFGFARFPEFRARLMTASAVHKLSLYCVQWSVYCLTRIYNPGT